MKARENPFRTELVLGVRYRMRGETMEDLLDRLRLLGYRGALVGPKGSGKTTLLEELEPALGARGFDIKRLRLDDRSREFPRGFLGSFFAELTDRDVILFDGAEQMSRFGWKRFKRQSIRAGGLVITSHRAGKLTTLRECRTSPELLDEIIGELLGARRQAPRGVSDALYHKHNGNLRDALREMYDVYAGDALPERRELENEDRSDLIGCRVGVTLRLAAGD